MPITITSVGAVIAAQPLIASASAIVSAQIALHLSQAEALIWARASKRYTVPITPTPPLLESICIDLACYGVLVKQAIIANTLEDSPWPDRYKAAEDLLNEIADGDLPLLGASAQVIDQTATTYASGFSNTTYRPTYAELPPEYLHVDPDKEQDLIDERE